MNIGKINNNESLNLFPFNVSPFRVNHTIPDNFGFIIKALMGSIVHTSDFKFDKNPVNDKATDINRLKKIGNEGVLFVNVRLYRS